MLKSFSGHEKKRISTERFSFLNRVCYVYVKVYIILYIYKYDQICMCTYVYFFCITLKWGLRCCFF